MQEAFKFSALFIVLFFVFTSCEDDDQDGYVDLPNNIQLVDDQSVSLGDITFTTDTLNAYVVYNSTTGHVLETINLWITEVPGDTTNFVYSLADDPGTDDYIASFELSELAWPEGICELEVYMSGWGIVQDSRTGARTALQLANTMVDGEPCDCAQFTLVQECEEPPVVVDPGTNTDSLPDVGPDVIIDGNQDTCKHTHHGHHGNGHHDHGNGHGYGHDKDQHGKGHLKGHHGKGHDKGHNKDC